MARQGDPAPLGPFIIRYAQPQDRVPLRAHTAHRHSAAAQAAAAQIATAAAAGGPVEIQPHGRDLGSLLPPAVVPQPAPLLPRRQRRPPGAVAVPQRPLPPACVPRPEARAAEVRHMVEQAPPGRFDTAGPRVDQHATPLLSGASRCATPSGMRIHCSTLLRENVSKQAPGVAAVISQRHATVAA